MAKGNHMLSLYSCLIWLFQPFVRRKLKRRAMAESVYGERIEERFGSYPNHNHQVEAFRERPFIWLHAVSLGEVRAAAILLKQLRIAIPDMRLLLTNGTATGRVEGAKLLLQGDVQVWQPWDTAQATRDFFAHFQPALGILMETEIWPNLIHSASKAHVPVLLANARLSEKSFKKSQQWFSKRLASLSYQGLTAAYAQTNDDASRLTRLGAKVNGIFGNLKFDVTPNEDQLREAAAMREKLTKPVIAFASSREGEEALFLNALQALSDKAYSSVHWLVIPRHPQRFNEVAGLMETAGFAVSRRSINPDFGNSDFDKLSTNGSRPIWLGDSVGEMPFYGGLSSVALLGGSFERLGGQNLIELLACGCPVVMGEHTFNFEEAARLAATAGVAFRVDDLASAIQKGLAASDQYQALSPQSMSFVACHRGAAEKSAAAIRAQLVTLQATR